MDLLDLPHHDGSARYVERAAPALGDRVAVFLRAPTGAARNVHLRQVIDGEPRFVEATVDREGSGETWWRADVAIENPLCRYRFLVDGGHLGQRWVNQAGTWAHDVSDAADFALATFAPPPDWLADTVLYQVFPDRFAPSGAVHDTPDWATRMPWDVDASADGRVGVKQWFGGDLPGLTARLDHIGDLGATAIYLTPFFPSRSAHRYDASTFDHVDPLLGGDDALVELTARAHDRGMRVIGDLTTNHTGAHHEWFQAAQAHPDAPEASFYVFRAHPEDYVAWYGVRSLPKLDHRSAELRRRLVSGPDSVAARWLEGPYALDGWRIDVANMTARQGEIDLNHEVARDLRATIAAVRPDGWLVAEHCYDASPDLAGDGWHGTMAYSWFTRPVWSWLCTADAPQLMGVPGGLPRLGGAAAVAGMRALAAGAPWRSVAASMTLLDSHDTARFASVVGGDRARHLVGVALLMTLPGVPMVFAGDEIGLRGRRSDEARQPFPWDERRWDLELLGGFRQLIALRRGSHALRHGGLRWVHVADDSLTYLRESVEERVLVHVARASHEPVVLDSARLGVVEELEPLLGGASVRAAGGAIALPGDGPAAHAWRIAT